MTKRLLNVSLLLILILLAGTPASSQCPGGYTQSQLNWDNLDYYWNSGGSGTGPYQTYITDAMEQSQRFAIGRTWLTIATSSPALVNPGSGNSAENTTHTGDVTGYTGADVQYNPSANGQTITITFNENVANAQFTLYDVDGSQRIDFSALNAASVAQNINVVTYASSILTITNNNATNARITASSTTLGNASNQGTATITVAGPVRTITLTITTIGSDVVFWLSDINACVNNGVFPTNYHQGANNRPFVGPTQNMPDYFLVTPDNDGCYYLDPATGQARILFQDSERDYMNSFAYDPYNRFLYYITENSSINTNNRQLKRYDYNTETSSVVLADITASLGIPVFNYGIESAGAAFYDGSLYLGIEGGKYDPSNTSNDRTRETIIWRIDFDGSNNPISAYQVMATDHFVNASNTSLHDWGDFIMKNGMIYNSNTSRNGTNYSQSKYHHYNLTTGQMDALYTNPGTNVWTGQIGMNWAQGLYYFRPASGGNSEIGLYNEAGTNGAPVTITVVSGPSWPGGSGDASDPFRPKCDFGDAPASYDPYADPATQSPAVHERTENIRLGSTWDYEFLKRGVSGTDDVDDGLAFVPFMPQGSSTYVTQVSIYNNSGADATLMAWLDYNGNGVFDAGEVAQIVPAGPISSSAAMQSRYLYWPSFTTPLVNGQSTYLRIRITSASAGMTAAHPTGYFANGEVEDYRVMVDNYPLSVTNLLFNASLVNNSYTKLTWSGHEENGFGGYELQRSRDGRDWQMLALFTSNGQSGQHSYEYNDPNPQPGNNFYRLMLVGMTGQNKYSEVKLVKKTSLADMVTVNPNPVITQAVINIKSEDRATAYISLVNSTGSELYKQTVALNKGDNNIPLPVEGKWPGGTYLLRVAVNNETVHKKLLLKK